jgi:hypothetical protein
LPLDQAVDLGMASVLEGELMTKIDSLKLYESVTAEELETFRAKIADYTDRTGENVLVQFDRLAASLGTTPVMVLLIYREKHLDTIRSSCRHGAPHSELIEGSIGREDLPGAAESNGEVGQGCLTVQQTVQEEVSNG